jgi:hypothetical protein
VRVGGLKWIAPVRVSGCLRVARVSNHLDRDRTSRRTHRASGEPLHAIRDTVSQRFVNRTEIAGPLTGVHESANTAPHQMRTAPARPVPYEPGVNLVGDLSTLGAGRWGVGQRGAPATERLRAA